jgi:hypothetical protein
VVIVYRLEDECRSRGQPLRIKVLSGFDQASLIAPLSSRTE